MSTTDASFFEAMYQADVDPWGFTRDAYERTRYRAVLRHVPAGRFADALEPGCSIGELTHQLARRCGHVTAFDISETAVMRARRRCHDLANVDIDQGRFPDDVPDRVFDLIVLSEIGYYFAEPELATIARRLPLADGGRLVAVHWLGCSSDHLIGGRRVHEILDRELGLARVEHVEQFDEDRTGFVLDVWSADGADARAAQEAGHDG